MRARRQRRAEGGRDFGWRSLVLVPPDETESEPWLTATNGEPSLRGRRKGSGMALSLSVGTKEEVNARLSMLEVVETAAAPRLVDWDSDGDVDMLAQSAERLHVWIQEPRGRFERVPTHSWPLPVPADRERRLDPSYSANVLDLSADGRADCVIFASDKRSSDVRAQSLVFVQGGSGTDAESPLFGPRGRPSEVLVFAGFVSDGDFARVDADAFPELVAITVRLDLIDQVRSASTESIDADLSVFRNRRGSFSKRPDLSWRYSVPLRNFEPTLRFFGDVTKDGLSELLVRTAPDRVRLHLVRAQGEGWSVVERPVWELGIQDEARVRVARARRGRKLPDLLVIERNQVLHGEVPLSAHRAVRAARAVGGLGPWLLLGAPLGVAQEPAEARFVLESPFGIGRTSRSSTSPGTETTS